MWLNYKIKWENPNETNNYQIQKVAQSKFISTKLELNSSKSCLPIFVVALRSDRLGFSSQSYIIGTFQNYFLIV